MKRMKDFLDFLGSLVKAWPALVVIAGLLVSVALAPTQIASTVVSLSIPLPLFIAIAALALYPIAKLVQRLFEHRKQEPFSYSGLLWKPALLGFRYPRPVSHVKTAVVKYPVDHSHLSKNHAYQVPL
jgi:hypothetical protein